MRQWLADAIDQIALGEILADSGLSCGQRFALIAIDNSIEFMLVAYVEVFKRLVGGHKTGGIPKQQWEKKKRNFSDLLSFVVSKEPALSQFEQEINRYHDLRNDLYHTGRPRTVSRSKVLSYAQLARTVLGILFAIQYDQAQWKQVLDKAFASLTGNSGGSLPIRSVTFQDVDGAVRYSTQSQPTAKEAISLVLHAYSISYGREPTREELLKSLALSGYAMTSQVLSSRLYELRRNKLIRNNSLGLTAKGRKHLAQHFLLPTAIQDEAP
jgi:hypothetical protein